MGIFKRLKDIIGANINDLLEKFEDPENVIDEMIKEMEESIIDIRKQTASAIASSKMTERKISTTAKEEIKWQSNAELAITEGPGRTGQKSAAAQTRKLAPTSIS